jgi:hypothetical protein
MASMAGLEEGAKREMEEAGSRFRLRKTKAVPFPSGSGRRASYPKITLSDRECQQTFGIGIIRPGIHCCVFLLKPSSEMHPTFWGR